jgi:hypothetical protein
MTSSWIKGAAAGAILAAAIAGCANSSATHMGPGGMALPFIENDYAGAIAKAKAASLPVFVEVWAPW